MRIKYLGPSPSVNVATFGAHQKNEVKEYPDDFAVELLATSRKQRFETADEDGGVIAETPPLAAMTVAQLKALLEKLGVEPPAGAKKADLVDLVMSHTAEPPAED